MRFSVLAVIKVPGSWSSSGFSDHPFSLAAVEPSLYCGLTTSDLLRSSCEPRLSTIDALGLFLELK